MKHEVAETGDELNSTSMLDIYSMNEKLYRKLVISEITEEVKGFKTFVFEEGHQIEYSSGQYLTLVKFAGDKEIRRSYSITSSPFLNEPLSIGVKRVENGWFSRELVDDASPGDEVLTTGAGGFFILPENTADFEQVFFFAAGAGITPVLSLIKTALYAHAHLNVVLVYSNASPSKAAYLNILRSLEKQFSGRLKLELLFSNSADLSKARLYRDLLLQLVDLHSLTAENKRLFYICGPEAYMRMCTYVLQETGIPGTFIRKENFVIHTKPAAANLPPDKEERQVTLRYGNDVYQFKVHYPDPILKAAKKQNITLPYSCEVGRCGNCVAKCLNGKVWHSYNEVLTEKELAAGLVLTCVGHPVDGDVELVIK